MTRSLTELAQGTRVFIDANIFVYHISADSRLNQACADFLRHVEQGLLACPHVKGKDLVRHLKTHPDIVKTLQIMNDFEVRAIASNDSDFERVDAITVYKP